MLRGVLLLSLGGLAIGCGSSEQAFAGELEAPVIYGADDRAEVFAHPDPELRRIARQSIAALIQTYRLNRGDDGTYSISAISLKDERGLCDDERFADQPVAASCSATLIDDDLVLTAGHCISADRPCDSFHYVFNYYLDGPNLLASIRDEDVYGCERVVLERDARSDAITPDYAVIQLDRPVEGSQVPVEIRPAVPLQEDDALSMIGFGSGLPAKIDSGASVAEPPRAGRDFFVANLDAFEGHSGSSIFDANHQLAGILLGGRVPDYVMASGEICYRVNEFDDSEAGELVHDISTIVRALCDDGWTRGETCETSACQGDLCEPSPPQGVVPADTSGCSAAAASPAGGPWALFTGLGLLWLGWELRRRVV
jgi:hypothetical protein